jgi:hypothetical protein
LPSRVHMSSCIWSLLVIFVAHGPIHCTFFLKAIHCTLKQPHPKRALSKQACCRLVWGPVDRLTPEHNNAWTKGYVTHFLVWSIYHIFVFSKICFCIACVCGLIDMSRVWCGYMTLVLSLNSPEL